LRKRRRAAADKKGRTITTKIRLEGFVTSWVST
jgi:hypothetical protein